MSTKCETNVDHFPNSYSVRDSSLVISKSSLSTKVRQSETLIEKIAPVEAALCYYRLLADKTTSRRKIVLEYEDAIMTKWGGERKLARKYLEAELKIHGLSHRTIMRIIPEEMKDYTKRANRLGKTKLRKSGALTPGQLAGGACYQEPD
jgi:hypothetical protein